MNKVLSVVVVGVLALHGLIHLMGAAAYLRLTEVQGLPYKTTVFDGRWNLGEPGTAFFGGLWGVAALGFGLAVIGMVLKRSWWQLLLLASTLLSLVLGAMDWEVAKMGVAVNLVILVGLWALVLTRNSQPVKTVGR
jgi:hypothetical protein